MTDPELADATYIEPITPEILERVLERERPDALLPTMGGQTGLNAAMDLVRRGALDRYGVELIGASADVVAKAEDRQQFHDAVTRIGLACPKSRLARSLDDGLEALDELGLPLVVRPSFTLGGIGGGIAYNRDEFEAIVANGISTSPVREVLVEESVLGWKEFELEVVRDRADNCIVVCSIENVDPMGIHTGDSITVAPALTLTDKEYQILRDAAIAVLREIGVDTGGSNVQFAVEPDTGRMVVIEMNPRVSRSSALASKATRVPHRQNRRRLAVGYTLDEIANDITGATPASFEPAHRLCRGDQDPAVRRSQKFPASPGCWAPRQMHSRWVRRWRSAGPFPKSMQKGAAESIETGQRGTRRGRRWDQAEGWLTRPRRRDPRWRSWR